MKTQQKRLDYKMFNFAISISRMSWAHPNTCMLCTDE